MALYLVKLTALSTWNKVVRASSPEEACKKGEEQSDGWAKDKWVHFTQEASEPEAELVTKDGEIMDGD